MARKSTKTLVEQCEKITSRFAKSQAEKMAAQCEASGIKPSQYLRLAGMAFTDFRFLDLIGRMQRVEDEILRLRDDFNEAVQPEVR